MTVDETVPTAYVPGPLTPAELVDVLGTSVRVLHSDRGHDVFTYFDILIQDHLRDLSPGACNQVARTVVKHLTGIGAPETREPIRALHRWHQRNRNSAGVAAATTSTLERAFSDALRTFGNDSPVWGAESEVHHSAPLSEAHEACAGQAHQ